jgi:hypothetical protein
VKTLLVSVLLWGLAFALVVAFTTSCARAPLIGPLFTETDKTIYGTLVIVERNEDYEARCGFLCRVMGGSEGPRAYEATVVDTLNKETHFMFFAPAGNTIPHVGQRAFWRLRTTEIVNVARSTSYSTVREVALTLWSDEDVIAK